MLPSRGPTLPASPSLKVSVTSLVWSPLHSPSYLSRCQIFTTISLSSCLLCLLMASTLSLDGTQWIITDGRNTWTISETCYCIEILELWLLNAIQQQLSHLSQVFGVGYMNQKRIMPDRAHGSNFSTHSYRAVCLHSDYWMQYIWLNAFVNFNWFNLTF